MKFQPLHLFLFSSRISAKPTAYLRDEILPPDQQYFNLLNFLGFL